MCPNCPTSLGTIALPRREMPKSQVQFTTTPRASSSKKPSVRASLYPEGSRARASATTARTLATKDRSSSTSTLYPRPPPSVRDSPSDGPWDVGVRSVRVLLPQADELLTTAVGTGVYNCPQGKEATRLSFRESKGSRDAGYVPLRVLGSRFRAEPASRHPCPPWWNFVSHTFAGRYKAVQDRRWGFRSTVWT